MATPIKISAAIATVLAITISTAAIYHALADTPTPITAAPQTPTTRPIAVIDLATPESALASVFSATEAENEPALLHCLYATNPAEEKLNKAWAAATIASQRLLRSMHEKFGDDSLLDSTNHPWPDDYSELFAQPALDSKQLPTLPGTLVGNNHLGWARLVQQNTQWHFAIAQTYPHDRLDQMADIIQAQTNRINTLADDIASGACPTLEQARTRRIAGATGGKILLPERALTAQN